MATNTLTVTSPISPSPIVIIAVDHADGVNDREKTMTVELVCTCADGSTYGVRPRLRVANGTSDSFGLGGAPTFGTVATPSGFDQVMGAYVRSASTGAMLTAMVALGLLPAGTVA